MKIKACIFDLDGTLLNTLPTITYYLNRMHGRFGLPSVDEAEVRGFIGHGARNLVRRSLSFVGADENTSLDEVLRDYTSDYDTDPGYLTVPFSGICDMLDRLIERGIILTVYTNKPSSCAANIIREIFGDRFLRVVGADPTRHPLKPSPDAALEMLREIDILPSECAYLGDMTVDSDTASAIGVGLTVLCDWGFDSREVLEGKRCDAIISHPSELPSLIDCYRGGEG